MNTIALEEVKKILFDRYNGNIVLLEYSQMNNPAKFKCIEHNIEWVAKGTKVIRSGCGCPECAKISRSKKLAHSYDYVRNFIERKNCQLISSEYKNTGIKLEVRFECGHHGLICFDNFKNGVRCSVCAKKATGKKKRIPIELMAERLAQKHIKIIEIIGEYTGTKSMVKTSCEYGHIEIHRISSLLLNRGCTQCSFIKLAIDKSGKNGNNWQGGKDSVLSFLKKRIKEWKKASLKNSNYVCDICHKKGILDIHHPYSFFSIVNDALFELQLDKKLYVFNYTEEELFLLTSKVLEIHYRHPLGAALCRKHHKIFHVEYGQYNNTPIQFFEFQQKIQSGDIIIPE